MFNSSGGTNARGYHLNVTALHKIVTLSMVDFTSLLQLNCTTHFPPQCHTLRYERIIPMIVLGVSNC